MNRFGCNLFFLRFFWVPDGLPASRLFAKKRRAKAWSGLPPSACPNQARLLFCGTALTARIPGTGLRKASFTLRSLPF